MPKVIWLLLAMLLTGCTETIVLRHPDGRTAACGNYFSGAPLGQQAAQREARCLNDFERQGFVRQP